MWGIVNWGGGRSSGLISVGAWMRWVHLFLGLACRSRGHSISPLVEAVELWKAMMRVSVGNGGERKRMGEKEARKMPHPPAPCRVLRRRGSGGGGRSWPRTPESSVRRSIKAFACSAHRGQRRGSGFGFGFWIGHRMAEGSEGEGDKRPLALQMRGPLSQ